MSENKKRNSKTDPAAIAAEERELAQGKATLIPLEDGTYRMVRLKLGDDNKRHWEMDENGNAVWHPWSETVYIPDGVSEIGQLSCPILGSVVIPPSVRELDDLAFGVENYSGETPNRYALHTVIFSQGLRRIGYRAFFNCRDLDGVRLPKGLREIGEDAFCFCRSISDITVPETVEGVEQRAFGYCSDLKKAVFRDGCRWLGGMAFAYCNGLDTVILPKTLVFIGSECFLNCASLKEIDRPESVKKIYSGAFKGCVSLKSFTFKSCLENVEDLLLHTPFAECDELTVFELGNNVTNAEWLPSAPKLQEIRVGKDHPAFTSGDGVLYSKDKKTLVRVPSGKSGEFTVPRGVAAIAPHAFHECVDITEVTFPSTLTSIGEGAFCRCYSLRSIEITGKVKSVGALAFEECSGLTGAHISHSVSYIGECAFYGCDALKEITVSPQNARYTVVDGKIREKDTGN